MLNLRHSSFPISTALLATGAFTAVMLPVGCSTTRPPTVPEIQDSFDREQQRLIDILDEWMKRCDALPDTAPPPAQGLSVPSPRQKCKDDALAFFNEALRRIQEARVKGMEQAWDDARKAKEAYEEWLRKQIDNINIPGIIRDLIKPLLPTASITTDLSGSIGNITTNNGVDDGVLNLSGTFSMTDTSLSYSEAGTMVAKFNMSGSLQGNTPSGKIYSGSVDFTTSNGASWTGIVETDDRNLLSTAASGSATITVLMKSTVSAKGWGSILPVYPRIQLKLQRQSNGNYRVQGTNQPSSTFFNRDPYAITDYDGNRSRVFAADYTAFASGLAAQDSKADINNDGAWDSADTDLWLRLFSEDAP